MLQRVRHSLGRGKGYLISHLKAGLNALAYGGLLPAAWRWRLIARFWEDNAAAVHARWGSGRDDYGTLGEILERYRPASLLDAGCGSGRLFPLYQQCGVRQVVGTDISEAALAIARRAFPRVDLRCIGLTELTFADNTFDFCICNRVLQHVPSSEIREVISSLARISRWVYVNELTQSDDMEQAFFMRRHDYETLFNDAGMIKVESGLIDKQTYAVFGCSGLPAQARREDA